MWRPRQAWGNLPASLDTNNNPITQLCSVFQTCAVTLMATVSSTRTGPHWQHWFRVAVFATVLTCPLSLQAAPDPFAQDAEAAAKRTFKEWVEVLGIPNVSAVPADIQRNTSWFEQAFQRRGFHTRQLPNNGKPMLFAGGFEARRDGLSV